MDWQERIIVDPDILIEKPFIKGKRLAVEFTVILLGQGWFEAVILKNYPGLTREDILACLGYASVVLNDEHSYSRVVSFLNPISLKEEIGGVTIELGGVL